MTFTNSLCRSGLLSGGEALRRRTHYVTTNASGVRDYAPGDSFSRIHWRSTARRNRLIVKEFELDPFGRHLDRAGYVRFRPCDPVGSAAAHGSG
jgi:hypothetical protein